MTYRRTGLTAIIVALALGIPYFAWYVSASVGTTREAERLKQQPRLAALGEVSRMANRLAVRLEALRQSETRRTYTDYHAHDDDSFDDCSCETPQPSPLAEGPADPLVWSHFQIDEVGQISLPNLDPSVDPHARVVLTDERAILEVLECELPRDPGGRLADVDPSTIHVGPLQWHTVSLEEQPALVALRGVTTPAALLTQGFVVRREALVSLLAESDLDLAVRQGEPTEDLVAVRIPIEGPDWSVTADVETAETQGILAAAEVERAFGRRVGLGLLGLVVAGGLIVTLVAQAERLASQRARFAAAAAHELRTPLTGLRMYGEMLSEAGSDPERARRYARRIAGEAERLGRVVSNLLGFARLERGELRLSLEVADLADAVRAAMDRLAPDLEARGAPVTTRLGRVPPARFDRDAVHQILQNLLDNAEKYSRVSENRTIRVDLEARDRRVELSVTDRGPGVDPRVRERLFQAFSRGTTEDAPDGLGLGLTLVQALARAQGAQVMHTRPPGGGARFTVSFPAAARIGECPEPNHTRNLASS